MAFVEDFLPVDHCDQPGLALTGAAEEPAKSELIREKGKPMIRTVAVLLFEGVELMDFADLRKSSSWWTRRRFAS